MKVLGPVVALAFLLPALPAHAESETELDENELRLAAGIEGVVGVGYDDLAYGVSGAIGFRGPAGLTLRARGEALNSDQFRSFFLGPELRIIARDRVFFAAAPGVAFVRSTHPMTDVFLDTEDSTTFAAQARVGAFVTTGPRRIAVSLSFERIWEEFDDADKLVTLAVGFESL